MKKTINVLFLVFILTGLLLPMKVYDHIEVSSADFTEQAVVEQVYAIPAVPAVPMQKESLARGILLSVLWLDGTAQDVINISRHAVFWVVCCVLVYHYLYQLWITHQMDGKKRLIFLLP